MTFDGAPEVLMRRVLGDLKGARRHDDRRDRAFVSLVGRYLLEQRRGPVPERTREAFLRKCAKRLGALGPDRYAGFLDALEALVERAAADPTGWREISLRRSAVQVIVDDHPHPTGWFDAGRLDALDARLREVVTFQHPVPWEEVPAALAGTHWWWHLPESKMGYLAYGHWPGADLENRRLVEAVLRHAAFPGANFNGVDAYGADANGIALVRASLKRARFAKAQLVAADLRWAIAAGASFTEAVLPAARFDRAWLKDARFIGADLRGATFVDADLTQADFSHALLDEADFTGAQVRGATFTGARLRATRFSDARSVETAHGLDLTRVVTSPGSSEATAPVSPSALRTASAAFLTAPHVTQDGVMRLLGFERADRRPERFAGTWPAVGHVWGRVDDLGRTHRLVHLFFSYHRFHALAPVDGSVPDDEDPLNPLVERFSRTAAALEAEVAWIDSRGHYADEDWPNLDGSVNLNLALAWAYLGHGADHLVRERLALTWLGPEVAWAGPDGERRFDDLGAGFLQWGGTWADRWG
jgi:hypothetical protein